MKKIIRVKTADWNYGIEQEILEWLYQMGYAQKNDNGNFAGFRKDFALIIELVEE